MRLDKAPIKYIFRSMNTVISVRIDKKLKNLAGSKCKKIYGPTLPGEQKRSCLDYSKAKKELSWQLKYSLDEGLNKTIKWFRNKSSFRKI